VAIGYSNGDIQIANLQTDQVLFTFKHAEGSIRSLSFSSDSAMGVSLLASVSGEGQSVTLWDLNKQKIYSIIQLPHNSRAISNIQFMNNEPILITSSDEDNSLKMWFFEKGSTQPRILKERCGHALPPHKIRFYGGKDDPVNQGARNIISCAPDGSLRDISLLNEF
jgi:U3 small nucleolar RNA-associated protein 21